MNGRENRRMQGVFTLHYAANSDHGTTGSSPDDMRLTRIKLAGFKSFVDPTSIHFPSNLTGVVGPNGCGKSNIIDAVRWVMGELSAKHLRGDSMADVIFNGSSARKPVGTASIELVFDNSDGAIGGQYASFNEVSLKRLVSRDGTSVYLINGARCRRKDITQLFLGTGLGSRSYAIIEQGMISRLIEAKPDELRAFIEEAAGISKYKERRRETENRMAHTRENLERLNDLREEVDKQIRHLQRQAATARRYQALKDEERKLQAELLALKLRGLEQESLTREQALRERETQMQAVIAGLRSVEAAIEKARAHQQDESERLNEVQARYYQLGAEAARIEQSIQHARELRQRQRTDLQQSEQDLNELKGQLGRDETQVEDLLGELRSLEPQHAAARESEEISTRAYAAAEQAMQTWQGAWEVFNRELGEAQQQAEVERARIEEIDNRLRTCKAQAERAEQERRTLPGTDAVRQLELLVDRELLSRTATSKIQTQLQAVQDSLQTTRDAERSAVANLDEARTRAADTRGRLVSLQALQRAALGQAQGRVVEWLTARGWADRPRLAQRLKVERGWERAVETVLGAYLEAVCVEGVDAVAEALSDLRGAQVSFVSLTAPAVATTTLRPATSLLAHVDGPTVLVSLLADVVAVNSLAEALAGRERLRPGESIVTRDGIWIGRHWLRVSRDANAHEGVLEREQELTSLERDLEAVDADVQRHDSALARAREALVGLEEQRATLQDEVNRRHQEYSELQAQLGALRGRADEAGLRAERLTTEARELVERSAEAEAAQRSARTRLAEATQALTQLERRRPQLEDERDQLRNALAEARARAQTDQARSRDVAIQLESRRSAQSSVLAALERMRAQLAQLTTRRAELAGEIEAGAAPLSHLERSLEQALARRLEVEGELRTAREAMESADAALRTLDEDRVAAEGRVEEGRGAMETARLDVQEVRVRRESVVEQFAATHFELAALLAALPAEATVAAWEQTLAETTERIERLGSVNLAAIEEFKEQSERKEYLDRQFADLTEALTTLEGAIRKIDRETRQRFQDTFDRINVGLKEKFPRLFGGGHAYLELTGEEILSAGVAVMARPPGKRNSTIHLLSGGEKALTAVALVFSIFELNPAPFCLLDEVDAPLDDHNVGRFCDIVQDMAQRVQFIFITHNKTTMELASQLIGVTMSEPGVSRLVAVDVEEAVRMAAM
jgi:chromosome segregation protein